MHYFFRGGFVTIWALVACVFTSSTGNAVILDFSSGWNLVSGRVSIPAAEAFSDQDLFTSVWAWKAGNWAVYLPGEADPGSYASSMEFSPLTVIEPGEGFWVNANASAPLALTGLEVSATTLPLTVGWNLKGLLIPGPVTVVSLFDPSMPVSSVWKWQTGHWAVFLPGEGLAVSEAYATSKGFVMLTTIEPGAGFWVNATAEAEIPLATSVATSLLNDTGINWYGSLNENFLASAPVGFAGQDADYGRDASASSGALVKTGGGSGGFDFTKLDGNGDALPASASFWSCVRDNHTGLTWEVKTSDGSLHDKTFGYSWYNSDPATNGGATGYLDPFWGGCGETLFHCNTEAYAAAVNSQGLCGVKDWRLPTVQELQSIVDYGRSSPNIDTDYFPYSAMDYGFMRFWTSSPSVYSSDYPWVVDFNGGYAGFYYANDYSAVLLVRGGQ